MADDVFAGVHDVALDLPTADPGERVGIVVKWRRRGAVLEGLVSREVGGRVTTEWLPAVIMTPIDSAVAAGETQPA